MLALSTASDDICLHRKNEENANGRAIFVIVDVGRGVSFYRIYDQQIVLASNIS